MLLDICLGTRTSWKILFVLTEAPGKAVSRKEIKELTRLGNKVLTKFLLLLEKFDMITSEKIGRTSYYKMNMNNQFTEQIIALTKTEKHTLKNQEFRTVNILRDFIYELTNTRLENFKKAILFGSHAKRTNNNTSDMDIAIITEEKDMQTEIIIAETIDKLKKRYKKEIQTHYYTNAEFEEQKNKDKLIQEIIKDGITLV